MTGTPDLVERAAEIAAVDAAVGRLAGGIAGVIVVEGPAGIGKTRVVAAAARPALTATAEPGDPTSDAPFATLHGLHWLTVNLAAERPLVLAVDDLHWCDRPSLRFLAHLLRRLEGLPVLVVASLRTGEPATDEALAADVLHDPLTVRLHPAALTPEGTRALAAARLGVPAEEGFARVCHEATGRCRAPSWRGSRGCPRRPRRWRAAWPCSATGPTSSASRSGPGSRRRRRPAPVGPWLARRSCSRSRPSASRTRSCAPPCTTTSRPANASTVTGRPPACWPRPAPRPSRSPPTCCCRRPPETLWP